MTEQAGVAEEGAAVRQMPGSLLRQAREAQGLTLGEVSGALKFSTRQIEALENDDHELLQGKTFLRGFVRAYARMLKLQPEILLDMLDEVEVVEVVEQIVPPENMGETNPVPFYRRHGGVILALFAITFIAVGFAWFYNESSSSGDTLAGASQPSAVAPSGEQIATQNMELPPVDLIPTESGTAAQSVLPSGLSFDFRDLSWLEVRDGSGQILLTGEFPAGQKQTASGQPPYQVWIGKASAVQMTYKGQPVDLLPYTRDEVARLTLDK